MNPNIAIVVYVFLAFIQIPSILAGYMINAAVLGGLIVMIFMTILYEKVL